MSIITRLDRAERRIRETDEELIRWHRGAVADYEREHGAIPPAAPGLMASVNYDRLVDLTDDELMIVIKARIGGAEG